MKFKVITIFMFLINSATIYAKDSVRAYYLNVNRAELLIIDSAFTDANIAYSAAFGYKWPDFKDEKNAFSCAYYSGDSVLAKHYADDLASKSYPVTYGWIAQDSLTNRYYYHFVVKDVDSILNNASFPELSYNFIDSLYQKDQDVRNKNNGNGMTDVDSLNLKAIKLFCHTYGFPTFNKKDDAFCTQASLSRLLLLLWHHRGYLDNEINNILSDAVHAGKLPPDEWATLTMYNDQAQELYYTKLWILDFNELNADKIREVNLNRAKFYLETISDYKRKFDAVKKYERTIGCTPMGYPFLFLTPWLVPSDGAIQSGLK